MNDINPGDIVKHRVVFDPVIQRRIGVVTEVVTYRRISGGHTVISVRWIGTENQCDDGTTGHDPGELERVSDINETKPDDA